MAFFTSGGQEVSLGAPIIVRGRNRRFLAAAWCHLNMGRFIFKTWGAHGYLSQRGFILTLQDFARVWDLGLDPHPGGS